MSSVYLDWSYIHNGKWFHRHGNKNGRYTAVYIPYTYRLLHNIHDIHHDIHHTHHIHNIHNMHHIQNKYASYTKCSWCVYNYIQSYTFMIIYESDYNVSSSLRHIAGCDSQGFKKFPGAPGCPDVTPPPSERPTWASCCDWPTWQWPLWELDPDGSGVS